MSVTACNLVNVKASRSKDGYTTYTQKWQVLTDSRTDGPMTVLDYTGIPQVGDSYSIPSGEAAEFAAFIGSEADLASEEDTLKKWWVSVKFSDDPGEASKKDPEQPPGNPEDDPPVLETYAVKGKQAVMYDIDGNLIASSANEPYDPVIERDDTSYMLRISLNQGSVDPAFYATYRDAVNSDSFFGCAPETVKVETPGAIQVLFKGGQKYYRVTWEFALKSGDVEAFGAKDDWRTWLIDYGMRRMEGTAPNQKYVTIKDLEGRPLTTPTLLNGLGGVNPIGSAPVIVRLTAGGFKLYKPMPFGVLFPGMVQSF
jgi:hypothetical protein